MRVPTTAGAVFFKANAPALQFEAALVTLLASRRPDCVPPLRWPPIIERGWMLMGDAGAQAPGCGRGGARAGALARRAPALRRRCRSTSRGTIGELLAAGVPDLRLANPARRGPRQCSATSPCGWARTEARRTAEAMPRRGQEDCARLASFGLPETIEHDDLHDGQVFVKDGRYLLLDWGDACVVRTRSSRLPSPSTVSSPGVSTTSSTRRTPGRTCDAYLAPFADCQRRAISSVPRRSPGASAGCVAPSTATRTQEGGRDSRAARSGRPAGCSSTARP